MGDPLEDFMTVLGDLGKVMDDVQKAIKKSDDLDQLAEALGISLDKSLNSQTPLAETKEQAQEEAATGNLSKAEKISTAIEKKIEEATR